MDYTTEFTTEAMTTMEPMPTTLPYIYEDGCHADMFDCSACPRDLTPPVVNDTSGTIFISFMISGLQHTIL